MFYHAKTERVVQLLFLMLIVSLILTNWEYTVMLYFLILFLLFIIATLFITFTFKITDGSITYQILLFSLIIYRKEVTYNKILAMKFKRVGWGRKCVIVQYNKHRHFRIMNFYPEQIYTDLQDFADKHNIPIDKTKDYLILETAK